MRVVTTFASVLAAAFAGCRSTRTIVRDTGPAPKRRGPERFGSGAPGLDDVRLVAPCLRERSR